MDVPVFKREIQLNGPSIDGTVRAQTNEFKICRCRQHSALAAIQRKSDGLVDSALLVNSIRVFALHQLTHVRVIWARNYRLPLGHQILEGHVGADVELARELRRNGRLELDRAELFFAFLFCCLLDEQFVQAF